MKALLFFFVFISLSLTPASLTIVVYEENGKTVLQKNYDNRIWDECTIAKEVSKALIESCQESETLRKL